MNHPEFTAWRLIQRAERLKQATVTAALMAAANLEAMTLPDEAAYNLIGAALLIATGTILIVAFYGGAR